MPSGATKTVLDTDDKLAELIVAADLTVGSAVATIAGIRWLAADAAAPGLALANQIPRHVTTVRIEVANHLLTEVVVAAGRKI